MGEVDSSTTIRPYHEGDEQALVELFARVFGTPITPHHWRWKLRGTPSPAENVWLAVAGEQPVFQYAAIAQRYRLARRELIGMVSVDTMTHPDFRRRGLLTRVAGAAYDRWRSGGAGFVIGLPNQQWGSRTTALGWQELFTLQWLARPLQPAALAARRLRRPWLRHFGWTSGPWNRWCQRHWKRDASCELFDVERADAPFDAFWERIRDEREFSAVRDARWVNWRFLDSPLHGYRVLAARVGGELRGYLAWRVARSQDHSTAILAELITARDDHHTREQLLGEFAQRMVALGAQSVITLLPVGSAEAGWLARRGFLRAAGFSVQVVPLAEGLPLDAMKHPANWLITGADFDVV